MEAEHLLDDSIPLLAGTFLFSIFAIFLISFVFLYNKAQIKFELDRKRFEQALLQTEVEIREQTIIDVSRDLHDNIGQLAALLKINLNQMANGSSTTSNEKLQESLDINKQLIADIKNLSASLNGNRLKEEGLLAAIQADVDRINRMDVFELSLDAEGTTLDIPMKTSIFLYRIFQEIMNNALSHAQAKQVKVLIAQKDQNLYLDVKDDGIGLNAEQKTSGNGLSNISKRCELIGATLNIAGPSNSGTQIEITVPLNLPNLENGRKSNR